MVVEHIDFQKWKYFFVANDYPVIEHLLVRGDTSLPLLPEEALWVLEVISPALIIRKVISAFHLHSTQRKGNLEVLTMEGCNSKLRG